MYPIELRLPCTMQYVQSNDLVIVGDASGLSQKP